MKRLYTTVLAGLSGLFVFAQNPPSAPIDQSAALPQKGAISEFNKASSVLGKKVSDSAGKELGKIHELVFDLETGQMGYAVIALSGDRQVAVPISALKPAENKSALVLNMSPAVLAAASGIKNDEWPAVDAFAVGGPAGPETGRGSSSDQSR